MMSKMNNTQYWSERALLQEERNHDQSDKTLSNLKKEYQSAKRNLQRQLNAWYAKYADERGISIAQAKKQLTTKENHKHQMTIEQFIAKAQTGDTWFDEEMRKQYIKSRVTRLQALQDQVAVQLALLGKSQETQTTKLLQNICQESYYRPLYNAARRVGIKSDFARFNENIVKQICQTPWSGKSFSQRIWQNNDKLIKEVRHILSQGAIDGASIKRMSRQLAVRMDVDYHRAECLIRTESNYVQNEATARAYEQMGIEKYQYLATLDGRTSQICRRLDNQVFTLKEKAIGVNYPPMHPRCRSTTIPYYDDEFTEGETRAARDEEGKTTKVDAKLSYKEWLENYVIAPELLKEVGLKVFIGKAMYDKMNAEAWQQIVEDVKRMPPEHIAYVNEHLEEIEHISASPWLEQTGLNSHYDWINKIIYLRDDLTDGEFAHELGHFFEDSLDLRKNEQFMAFLKPYGEYDIRKLDMTDDFGELMAMLPDDGTFISKYQRTLNNEAGLYGDNGKLNLNAITEYFSEGYRAFITDSELLKRKNPSLYRFIEELIK